MAESGSTEEQIEWFILNSQKIPQLPVEEPLWSLSSSSSLFMVEIPQQICPRNTIIQQYPTTSLRKRKTNSHWPPTDWKTAPDCNVLQKNQVGARYGSVPPGNGMTMYMDTEGIVCTENVPVSSVADGDGIVEGDLVKQMQRVSQDLETEKGESNLVELNSPLESQINSCSESEIIRTVDSAPIPGIDGSSIDLASNLGGDTLTLKASNDFQSHLTGRLGEAIAHKYFIEKFGAGSVKWVNEEKETGLPYDLIVGDEENSEHIEVKTTTSTNKDWFPITTREWQFASEKGDAFSIAHVVLVSTKDAKITVLKNPRRLCQKNILHLAILMSEQNRDSVNSTVCSMVA